MQSRIPTAVDKLINPSVTPMSHKVIEKLTDMWTNNPENCHGIDWLLLQELYCYVPYRVRILSGCWETSHTVQ